MYDFFLDDLSYKKDASQSSTWFGGSSYFAINAVDGNPLTCMRTLDIGTNAKQKKRLVEGRSRQCLQHTQH